MANRKKTLVPGVGNGSGKFDSRLSVRELEAGIPENGREREFPLTPGGGGPYAYYSTLSQHLYSNLTTVDLPLPEPPTMAYF